MFRFRFWSRKLQTQRVLSASAFQVAMDEERMRVDRNGAKFAIVLFDCGAATAARVAKDIDLFLAGRLRATDRAGLFDARRLAVMLPDTGAAGADKLVADVNATWPTHFNRLTSEVFVYPHNLPTRDQPDDSTANQQRPDEELFVKRLPWWKRGLDISGAAMALLITSPLMLIVAVAIKLSSPGPVFFLQKRTGLAGRIFTIYKFRTMRTDAEELKASLRAISEQDGPAFKLKNDPRVTPLGKYLRRTCIDEIPQFWNVLRGEMSLVGPRPLPCEESDRCDAWQRRRLTVTPGLTCIWQVSGGMRIPFIEWMRMDIRYTRTLGLWNDLKLLWATFWAVILHRASH